MLEIGLGHQRKALVHLVERFGKLGAHVLLVARALSAAALKLVAQLTLEGAYLVPELLYLPVSGGEAAELRYDNNEQNGAQCRERGGDIYSSIHNSILRNL